MEIIQEIGSYAGFAAVLGLAVLSALYFSQARDVKRLREWAGRAPERAPQPVEQRNVVAKPIPRSPARPVPGGTPPPVPRPPGAPGPLSPAAASAAGAAPAVAKGPAPATPAAGAESGSTDDAAGADPDSDVPGGEDVTSMDTVVHPPPAPPDDPSEERDAGPAEQPGPAADEDRAFGETSAGDPSDTGEWSDVEDRGDDPADTGEWSPEDDDPSDTGEWTPEDEHSEIDFTDEHEVVPATPAASAARPPQPPRPFPRRGAPAAMPAGRLRADREPILPPYAEARPQADGDKRSTGGGRRTALAALAALVVLAIGAFGVAELLGGDDSGTSDGGGLSSSGSGDDSGGGQPAIDPSQVTVAVLNGTTVPGLAATVGDKIAGEGFQLGTVTNNFDQERAESVVLYAPGAEREAAAVSRRLDVSQREPIDPDSQSLAGDASVVVVAGADQNR
jgi:hypothetical protein